MSGNSERWLEKQGGIGFLEILAIVFITLKLTGTIAWSWWWVLAPLWGPIVVIPVVIFLVLLVAAIR